VKFREQFGFAGARRRSWRPHPPHPKKWLQCGGWRMGKRIRVAKKKKHRQGTPQGGSLASPLWAKRYLSFTYSILGSKSVGVKVGTRRCGSCLGLRRDDIVGDFPQQKGGCRSVSGRELTERMKKVQPGTESREDSDFWSWFPLMPSTPRGGVEEGETGGRSTSWASLRIYAVKPGQVEKRLRFPLLTATPVLVEA